MSRLSSTKPKEMLEPSRTVNSMTMIGDLPWLEISVDHVLLPNGKEINHSCQVNLPEKAVVVAHQMA